MSFVSDNTEYADVIRLTHNVCGWVGGWIGVLCCDMGCAVIWGV